jgi:hypothetical protein
MRSGLERDSARKNRSMLIQVNASYRGEADGVETFSRNGRPSRPDTDGTSSVTRLAVFPHGNEENSMNTRHTLLSATIMTLACAVAVPAFAQETETTKTTTTTVTHEGPHQFVYYGDHDIYFAPDTKTYYWQEGGNWRSGLELPAESRAYIRTGGVKIQLDTDKPYERNDWVIEHYRHHHDD